MRIMSYKEHIAMFWRNLAPISRTYKSERLKESFA